MIHQLVSRTAFCAPAHLSNHVHNSPSITKLTPLHHSPCMILRSNGSGTNRVYKSPLDRSHRSPSHQNGSTTSTDIISEDYDTEILHSGGDQFPPSDGNGSNGSDHHHRSDGDDDNDYNSVNPEILAILKKANRDFSSLPIDVQSATVDQLKRLLAVEQIPLLGALARVWPALRNRLIANNRLPIQLGVELTVGLVTKTLAELRGRGDRFWKEFDFYLSDIALELVGDAMLVWLLSPSAVFASTIQKKGIGAVLQALPNHAGQAGSFSMLQRMSALGYKGIQFALVGFVSSMIGHGLTTALVKYRRAQAEKRGQVVDRGVVLAPVVPTSVVWGGFMMVSSNSRYQTVNSIEQRLLDPVLGRNPLLLTLVTFGVRFGNCYVGGMQWLPWAKHFGIQ